MFVLFSYSQILSSDREYRFTPTNIPWNDYVTQFYYTSTTPILPVFEVFVVLPNRPPPVFDEPKPPPPELPNPDEPNVDF